MKASTWAVLRAILVLPVNALVVIPAIILWGNADTTYAGVITSPGGPLFWGVFAGLSGKTLLAQSLPLLAWAALFALANAIYMPLFEEPGLEKRFGDDYRLYNKNVPRWLPRLTPRRGLEEGQVAKAWVPDTRM